MSAKSTLIVRGRAEIKNGGYASPSQHELCRKPLLKAHGTPSNSARACGNRPANAPHLSEARLFRGLPPKKWKRCYPSDIAEGQDDDHKSSHCQREHRLYQ
jgi:hypothetical protein